MKLKIDDIEKVSKLLNVLNDTLEGKDFNPNITLQPPDVNVPEINIPDIKIPPIRVPDINVPAPEVSVNNLFDVKAIIKALNPLKYLSNKRTKPIAVRLSDGKEWIKELKRATEVAQRQVVAYSTNTAMTLDEYKTVSRIPQQFGHLKITVTTAGTPINIKTSAFPVKDVYLSADTDAGIICVVGGSNTVRATANNKNGMIILPGNTPAHIQTNDLKNLWVDSESDGGVLCVSYSVI